MSKEEQETIELEGDLKAFAKTVFSEPPQKPNSLTLQLNTDTDTDIGETKEFVIFKQLAQIMCEGIPILFKTNEKVNIHEITSKQLEKLNEYFQSFGWKIFLEKKSNKEYRISYKNTVTGKFLPDAIYINI